MPDDAQLLRRYVDERSQEAFAELVRRHVDLVYFAALRRAGGDAHLADDIAQTVFADLARKAAALRDRPVLTGWLYTSTRFAAAQAVRSEQRRRTHEQEAHTMNELHGASDPDWNRLRPVIDEALDELDEHEREAVLLRFFERQPFAAIGARFSVSADAARMRVERALDKLRGPLARRGVGSTSAALATAFSVQAATSAPAGLVAKIVASAFLPLAPTAVPAFALWKILAGASAGALAVAVALHIVRDATPAPPAPVASATPPATVSPAASSVAEAATFATVEIVSEAEAAAAATETSTAAPAAAPTEFGGFSDRQKRILKTLWERRKAFPDTPVSSWGFKLGNAAPAATAEFAEATARLQARGLVGISAETSTVFLTPAGEAFCRAHAAEIDAYRMPLVPSVPLKFDRLPVAARDILKTLWEHHKVSPAQGKGRWGFKVSPTSPDFAAFQIAAAGLHEVNGLVGVGAKTGVVFLTDRGLAFCAAHAAEIDAYPAPARTFRPLPKSNPALPTSPE